jgi:hypothetical protein
LITFLFYRSLEKESESYEKKFLEFLECFNTIASDQIAHTEQEMQMSELADQMTARRSQSAANPVLENPMSSESDTAAGQTEKSLIKELRTHQLVKFFKELQGVQVKIFEYLNHRVSEYDQFLSSQSHLMGQSIFIRPSMPLKKYQISLFQNCLEAFKMILKVSSPPTFFLIAFVTRTTGTSRNSRTLTSSLRP